MRNDLELAGTQDWLDLAWIAGPNLREQQEGDEADPDPHTDFPLPGTGGGSGGGNG